MEFCSKTSFSDQKTAQEELVRIFFEKKRRKISPNREYLCPDCNTWHLSSNGKIDYVYNLKIKELQDKIEELSADKKVITQDKIKINELIRKNRKLSNKVDQELNTCKKRDKTINSLHEKVNEYKEKIENLRDKQTIIDKFFALLSAEKDLEVLRGISKFAQQKIKALKNG